MNQTAIKTAVKKARKNRVPDIIDVRDVLTIDNTLNPDEVKAYLRANLSAYELACGYVQTIESGESYLKMYREHNVFHVQLYLPTAEIKRDWLTFDTLPEARQAFKVLSKLVKPA